MIEGIILFPAPLTWHSRGLRLKERLLKDGPVSVEFGFIHESRTFDQRHHFGLICSTAWLRSRIKERETLCPLDISNASSMVNNLYR